MPKRLLSVVLVATALLSCLPTPALAQTPKPATGPAAPPPIYALITMPTGAAIGELATRLAQGRQSGLVSTAQLFQTVPAERQAETVPPDTALGAVAIVEFANDAALAQWQQSASSKLPAGFVSAPADLLSRLEVSPRDSKNAIFLLAEYEIAVPPARYQEYVDGYVMPQMHAWKDAGLITGSFMYAVRDRAGAPFHALLVLEHRDAPAYSRRDAVKEASRQQLAAIPSWRALSDVKLTIRTEKFLTRALLAELPLPVAK